MDKTLTVFTPTYNRASKLQRVYESLLSQTNHNFEWVIVDDGSTDNTETVVRGFDQSLFRIVYEKKTNGGKHTAYNRALQLAQGDYFFCVDSDDWLASEAVDDILSFVRHNDDRFILGYKTDEKGQRLSDIFPPNVKKLNFFTLINEHHCGGEFSIVMKTDFAADFPFPVFSGEIFVTESVIYDRMAQYSDVSLLPRVLTVCEYQKDGLSNNLNRIMKENPAGFCLYFMQRIDLQESFLKRFITAGKYRCFCIFAGEHRTEYTGNHSVMTALCAPVGLAFWIYYKLLRGF